MKYGIAETGMLRPQEQQRAEYWLARVTAKDKVLLTEQECEGLNHRLGNVDFAAYPDMIDGEKVAEEIEKCSGWLWQMEHYGKRGRITAADKNKLRAACNTEVLGGIQQVRWAVTLQRCNLRLLPTLDNWSDEPENFLFDMLQGTALDPAEPVAILHTSADSTMFFVQSRNYFGWVSCEAVGIATRKQLLDYAKPEKFLVVTTNRTKVDGQLYQLGARLPLMQKQEGNWNVLVPGADKQGRLQEKTVNIKQSGNFHQGWLPCTYGNLVKMAFTCLGDKYDWGGMTDSVDCSSFVGDVYRTVGIELPRDADAQELAAPFSLKPEEALDKRGRLQHVQPGDLLFREGHVMMFLGEDTYGQAILHAFSRCQVNGREVAMRRVAVTEADYILASGKRNLSVLTSVGRFWQ